MAAIGRVIEVWRYPVKSMGGEQLGQCMLGAHGVAGDRGWALRDELAGVPRHRASDLVYWGCGGEQVFTS
jgi:uncharacterized protein YcbX